MSERNLYTFATSENTLIINLVANLGCNITLVELFNKGIPHFVVSYFYVNHMQSETKEKVA